LLFRRCNLAAMRILLLQPVWIRFQIWREVGCAVPGHGRTTRQVVALEVVWGPFVAALQISVVGAVGSCGLPWLLAGKIGGAQVLAMLAHYRASSLRPSPPTSNSSANSDR
jgi:hypothetical protein